LMRKKRVTVRLHTPKSKILNNPKRKPEVLMVEFGF
jgi:hypothetical protein